MGWSSTHSTGFSWDSLLILYVQSDMCRGVPQAGEQNAEGVEPSLHCNGNEIHLIFIGSRDLQEFMIDSFSCSSFHHHFRHLFHTAFFVLYLPPNTLKHNPRGRSYYSMLNYKLLVNNVRKPC